MSSLMIIVWLKAVRINNYSIVDAAWAFGFFLNALALGTLGPGSLSRKGLIFFMVSAWSLRLSFFLYRRTSEHHPQEDSRYKSLRESYEKKPHPNVRKSFFWFFQYQAWSISILSLPFLLIIQNANPEFNSVEYTGFTLWILALSGESLSDYQMAKFKRSPGNKGKTCKTGLWRYSRHPNYFFESLIWWAFFLMALPSHYGYLTLYCPLLILFLLLKVTGIPLSEEQSLKSRGEDYLQYQQETSIFIPWFWKKKNF